MKKVVFSASALIALAILWYACSKSSNSGNSNGLSTQATAQASYDNQSGGVYKGEITGSSGYFEVYLQGSRPFIIYQWTNPQGSIDSLFTTSLTNWQSGQAISKAVFTGTDGSVFYFSVSANGSNPSIDSVHIPSHPSPVYAVIAKELSTSQVRVYAGTATAVSSNGGQCVGGTANLWVTGSAAAGTYLGSNGDQGALIGTVNGNSLQIVAGGNNSETGTLTISSDGNTISGTVTGSCSHTISLTRVF